MKSRVYQVSCKDCDQKYVGQTLRFIRANFQKHMAHFKYRRIEKSSVTKHTIKDKQSRSTKNHLDN